MSLTTLFLVAVFITCTVQDEVIDKTTWDYNSGDKYRWEKSQNNIDMSVGYAKLLGQSYVYKTIPTTGYEDIRVETRVYVGNFADEEDSCAMYYRRSSADEWSLGWRQYDQGWYTDVGFPATKDDDNPEFEVKLAAEVYSLSFGDNCLFDKLVVYGSPIGIPEPVMNTTNTTS